VYESEAPIGWLQEWNDVRHCNENCEAGAPTLAPVTDSEPNAGLDDLLWLYSRSKKPYDRLRYDKRYSLLEAFIETVAQSLRLIIAFLHNDADVSICEVHLIRRHVVGKRIESASGDEVETGVVPMTRQQSRLHSSTVERKTHVWAPILDGVCRSCVPEDTHRPRSDLAGKAPRLLEVFERSDLDAAWGCRSFVRLAWFVRPARFVP